MNNCVKCNRKIRSDYKGGSVCKACRSFCLCGSAKDWRAEKCRSCASKILTKAQWQNPEIRQKMQTGLQTSGKERKVKFDDITWDSFYKTKSGRYAAAIYHPVTGKRGTIRRHIWNWIKHNGPIPKGKVIHHKDLDKGNDDISNLQIMTQSEHAALHGRLNNNLQSKK